MPAWVLPVAAALLSGAGAYAKGQAAKKEQARLAEFQRNRASELWRAGQAKSRAEFEGMQRADSIRDREWQMQSEQQADFAKRLQGFDMVEKAKGLKQKQGERIKGQRDVIAQAKGDAKLRAGTGVKGRVSGAYESGSDVASGKVLSRADRIGQIMGRLSGTQADRMREGGMIGDIQAQRQAMAGRLAGVRADAAREQAIGRLQAIRAGTAPPEQDFTYDPSSTWGNRLSTAGALVGMYGAAAGAGLVGAGAKGAGAGMSGLGAGWQDKVAQGVSAAGMMGGAQGSSSPYAISGRDVFPQSQTYNLYGTYGR